MTNIPTIFARRVKRQITQGGLVWICKCGKQFEAWPNKDAEEEWKTWGKGGQVEVVCPECHRRFAVRVQTLLTASRDQMWAVCRELDRQQGRLPGKVNGG